MSSDHDQVRPARVREPVQVYLGRDELDRLRRLTVELATTKSDVLRKGLEALERELTDPERHPALSIIGIAVRGPERHDSIDVAREHDDVLAEAEIDRWAEPDDDDASA